MIRVTRLLAIALLLVSPIAVAQTAKEPAKEIAKETAKETAKDTPKPAANVPAPVPSSPERTTASFGDWVLRCEGTTITPAHRVCEVAQAITLQGQTGPIAQVALGRQAPNEPKRLTIVLPTNIAFAEKPEVKIAKAGATPIELIWQRCAPGGCFASAPVSEEILGTLGAQTEPGKLLFRDAADRDIALPLSFRGLTQALAALVKEQ